MRVHWAPFIDTVSMMLRPPRREILVKDWVQRNMGDDDDPLERMAAEIEQEKAEVKHTARRAAWFYWQLVEEGLPKVAFFTMLYSWFTMERDRVRDEREERKQRESGYFG